MSRKYNVQTRLLKAYERYTEVLSKRSANFMKHGYTPVDTTPLSFNDYVANREYLAGRGIATGNITNKIVAMQLYEFSKKQAKTLLEELTNAGITKIDGKKITLESLKAGGGNEAMSLLNEVLKQRGITSGYERAEWMTENFYQDSL